MRLTLWTTTHTRATSGFIMNMREVSDRLCKENGLSVIPHSQNKGMGYKEYPEAPRGTRWKQKLKQTIDRLVITAKDYDDFLRLMQEAGYEIKTGKYISFRACLLYTSTMWCSSRLQWEQTST